MTEMRLIEPDDTDRNLLLFGVLKTCPFCKGTATTINKVNEETQIYRSIVACSKCLAQVGYNAMDLDEARRGATERWDRRS